jgi:hypothetical protein
METEDREYALLLTPNATLCLLGVNAAALETAKKAVVSMVATFIGTPEKRYLWLHGKGSHQKSFFFEVGFDSIGHHVH